MNSLKLGLATALLLELTGWALLFCAPARAENDSIYGAASAGEWCDERAEEAAQGTYFCRNGAQGGRTYRCSGTGSADNGGTGGWSPSRSGTNSWDRRLCRNLAAAHCCNQSGFLRAVEGRCGWIHRVNFPSALIAGFGNSFLESCNLVRQIYGAGALTVGGSNSSVSATFSDRDTLSGGNAPNGEYHLPGQFPQGTGGGMRLLRVHSEVNGEAPAAGSVPVGD